ncbi:alpha/beta fold hydrolase [Pseudomonas cannabina]|uniref:3-hydroxyacyl-CoA-acyl carrier protein transferase n=3 Tax=Pseudomonas syringae group TaxID=136849 RepID=A0A3M3Q8R1_PSECA|nr:MULTISPECIES: alpha/beta hydrolase [Pseudomonas syringae group]KPB73269.1 3-hydroxyacyl-CoA-acyl carrier protein transferase [Pseudomonas syringae pv. maculicola]KPW17652.1 3-hydroxyacyl-CoA-acyl carrier protein transferase [Pseudomonas cannabina pv. alisalensis]MBM0137494.1 alpha/beta hydrolase [Pseudomonas cannabina pv. alisalensis]QHE98766.1 alpha/beta fold hydrolase [Pseudomonas syringae pv. maculicola str. ES4326]QQN20980.1 alpha/beta hydrolase [Pseudomonas cannabina pv. alisalensis]
MSPEKAVLDIQGQFRVYTEFYRTDAAAKTIILVNGSLATTASFAQTVRSLHPAFNVVLYDQPYSGKSKPHNLHGTPLTREQEGQLLLELIDHFNAEHVLSFSWGGAATLVALAHRPKRIESAVISSFSPVINEKMHDYLRQGITHLGAHNRYDMGHLINSTVGKHLPELFKRFNFRHISNLETHEYDQMHYHFSQVLELDPDNYLTAGKNINTPVLFINGALDEYTSASDATNFSRYLRDCSFSTIDATGHFLDMEHKAASRDSKQVLMTFLQPEHVSRNGYHQTQSHPTLTF